MYVSENLIWIINAVVIALIVINGIIGYSKGFIWQVLRCISILVCIIVSWLLSPALAELVHIFPKQFTPFQGSAMEELFYEKINVLCWFVIIFLVTFLLMSFINSLLKAVKEIPVLKQINATLGAVLSLIPSLILITIATFVLNSAIFTNGKDIVNKSLLKYDKMVLDAAPEFLSSAFAENEAIQKMLSDPKSLEDGDIANIINWMKNAHIDSQQIYDFLAKYGIEITKLNNLINQEN